MPRSTRTSAWAWSVLAAHLQLIQEAPEELGPLFRRAEEIRHKLQFWMTAADKSCVYWIERRVRSVLLHATPIDVAFLLRQRRVSAGAQAWC